MSREAITDVGEVLMAPSRIASGIGATALELCAVPLNEGIEPGNTKPDTYIDDD